MKASKGVTLIELMMSLIISSILIAALYRTFISQQKTYTAQEQVIDIQQNLRVSINRMMNEMRTAGFGNVEMVLPVSFTAYGKTRNFNNIVNIDTPVDSAITVVSAIRIASALEKKSGDFVGGNKLLPNQFTVSRFKDDDGDPLFDTENRRYISIGGVESHTISGIDSGHRIITLNGDIIHSHLVGTPIFTIRAISYQIVGDGKKMALKRDENIGGGRQPLAENVENLQFEYFGADGGPTMIPANVRMIRVSVTARSDRIDPELKGGDGYRRRQISSCVFLRNMGSFP